MANQCGRPTKNGTPCKNRTTVSFIIAGYGSGPCSTHAHEQDRDFSKAIHEAWSIGFSDGQESERLMPSRPKTDPVRVATENKTRMTTASGAQIVCIGNHAYLWNGPTPLEVGDRVILPPNWCFNFEQEKTVTSLGSTYTGAMVSIVRRVAQAGHALAV